MFRLFEKQHTWHAPPTLPRPPPPPPRGAWPLRPASPSACVRAHACMHACVPRGSWDVLGIYPESTNAQGSYRDPAVVDMVRAHNDKLAPSK